jgi:hypothetical protein
VRGNVPELRLPSKYGAACCVLVVVFLAAAVSASGAAGAITPRFSTSQAHVGDLVTIYQPGGKWPGGLPIRIYLVRANIVGSVLTRYGVRRSGPPPPDVGLRYIV